MNFALSLITIGMEKSSNLAHSEECDEYVDEGAPVFSKIKYFFFIFDKYITSNKMDF